MWMFFLQLALKLFNTVAQCAPEIVKSFPEESTEICRRWFQKKMLQISQLREQPFSLFLGQTLRSQPIICIVYSLMLAVYLSFVTLAERRQKFCGFRRNCCKPNLKHFTRSHSQSSVRNLGTHINESFVMFKCSCIKLTFTSDAHSTSNIKYRHTFIAQHQIFGNVWLLLTTLWRVHRYNRHRTGSSYGKNGIQ